MPYIGKTVDGFGVRNRFIYVASADDTSVSGADANGATLTFTDGAYVDVYLNGVLLKTGTDYNTNTANTIAGLSALAANDEVTVVVYDVFTVGDMVSATSGGTFSGATTHNAGITSTSITATGDVSLDGGSFVFNESSADKDFRVESNGNTHMLFVDGGNDALAVGTSSADTNATMTVSNTGDNHAISIVGALNKSRMHFQGANTGSASTDGLVIGLSSSDDTNDDSALIGLKESGSLTLQTNNTNHLIIDGNGHVTMPKQSCFHVKGSRQNNVPKNATTDIQFNSERFDLNGDFDTSTYTFTAPVTGKYQINIILRYDNGDMDNSYYSLYLYTSNSNYRPCIHSQLSFDQDVDYFNMNGSLIVDMDANDTAKVQLGIPNLGADQVDLELPESVFSGYLVA